jgi:UDP-N-acetylglucosamine--N-acetylmuramyl-(pentapeptide) pyrophosphoryl-undecaprenol N-acetylglucosamine transferase
MPQKPKKYKVLITGGHAATSAIAIVEAAGDSGRDWEFHWIGPKYAMEGHKIPTLALKTLPKLDVKVHTLIAGRLQRKITRWSFVSLLRFPIGFLHALKFLFAIKPNLILSFGGYAGFPVVFIGWLMRTPILIHDETYSFNRGNKLSSKFATKVAISRTASKKYYPSNKAVLTGNPLMKNILKVSKKNRPSKTPTIYVTGGSTGARSINDLIKEILKKLLTDYRVIHHTGKLDHSRFVKLKKELPKSLTKKYKVYESIDPKNIGNIFEKSDIIVSRAGANTVSEIIAIKRPAILIPLVISSWNEQEKNALFAEKYGIAKVLIQKDLTARKLLKEISKLHGDWEIIVGKVARKESPDKDAAIKLVDLVEGVLQ